MSFDHQAFSKAMKQALAGYLFDGQKQAAIGVEWMRQLAEFYPNDLRGDDEKKAFWINLYNGLTNYQIIHYELKESVWELPGFFSERRFTVGAFELSLDDIEHGILRRNGVRKKDKPRQFSGDDLRSKLMLEIFDPRIHFALNCGSVSCPSIAFYSRENIEQELALAEENFVGQEFLIDRENKLIHCSEIFIWYRGDFENAYLNDPEFSSFKVEAMPYLWKING